jgi:PAS domain S-box-containing protein
MHTERAFATDSIQVFEYHLPVDDHTCTYEARLVVCAPDQVVAIVRDITRRKQAEAALAESEERYRTLVEISPSAILLTDMDSTIRFCNQQAALLFGYDAVDDLIGLQGTDLLIPEISSEPLLQVQNVIESGNMRNIEYVMCRSDGSHFPAEVNSSLMTDAQGNPTAMVIVVRDTSETRMVEQAHLIHRRNLLRAIFDGLEDGLLLLDGEGYVLEVNKALATLFGSTPTTLVGENWATIYPHIARNFAGHVALHFPPRERLQRRRTLYHSPDGQTRILNLQIIALSGPDKAAEQVILHVVDVTETVHLQQRLIENERFAASGRLAASVAHEINTPLQSIQTFLELVQIASDADRDTFLQHALEEIQRTGRIVHQLLDLYRPGAAVPGRVAINELIERIVLLIGKSLRDHRIALERDLAADLPLLWGRADALMQVILNLMNNAIDAMPHGGVLRVQTRYHAQAAAIEVAMSDSGNGIAPDLQERIFEAFVTTKEDGLGLGLSISKQILQQHGGDIRVESAAGRGTTFTIVLPLNPGTEPASP